MKRCTCCGVEQPLTAFNRYSKSPDGRYSRCKTCRVVERREWRAAHLEEAQLYWRAYYHANLEKMRADYRARYQADPERARLLQRERYHRSLNRSRKIAREKGRRHRDKVRIHLQVQRALKAGRIVRPSACSRCGCEGVRLHGHHQDYSRPLDVTWLCVNCHMGEHRRLRGQSAVATGEVQL